MYYIWTNIEPEVLFSWWTRAIIHLYFLHLKKTIDNCNTRLFSVYVELWCLTPLSTLFRYVVAVSLVDGGNRRTRRKPPTCCKSMTNIIAYIYRVHIAMSGIRTYNFSGDRHWLQLPCDHDHHDPFLFRHSNI